MKSKATKGSRTVKKYEEDEKFFSEKPKVVIRRSAKLNPKIQFVEKEADVMDKGKTDPITQEHETLNTVPAVPQEESKTSAENPPVNEINPSSLQSPPISGFDVDGVSRNQLYVLRNMLVLCDCCVQQSPDGIFDVLARNFGDTGALMWWFRKIGKAHLGELVKNKHLVDAIRKTAHELYRELTREIGRPVPRW